MNTYFMNCFVATLLVFCTISCQDQNRNRSEITSLPKSIVPPSAKIPTNIQIVESLGEDLNGDEIIDSIFIVQKKDPSQISFDEDGNEINKNRKGIMIFFNNNYEWNLVSQNLDCFSSDIESQMHENTANLIVYIEKGKLFFNYLNGVNGYWLYNFRYKPDEKDFELIGYDHSENEGNLPKKIVSFNFLTKKTQTLTNEDKDKTKSLAEIDLVETWQDYSITSPLMLSEIEDMHNLTNYITDFQRKMENETNPNNLNFNPKTNQKNVIGG